MMTVFASLVALDAFVRAYVFQAMTLSDLWPHLAKASRDMAIATLILGQTPLFPWICKHILREWIFPDVDGEWKGDVESNWHLVENRAASATAPISAPVPVTVKIIARLFFIRINLQSNDDYSVSRTSFVNISKDPEDGSIRISYLYKNSTIRPKPTDCPEHDGAAILDFRKTGKKAKQLIGTYWTNRAWSKGLNTAGTINLKKVR